MGADMRALQLTRTRRPQAFPGVVGVPDIEIAHLRAKRCGDTKHLTGLDLPGPPGTNRHFELLDEGTLLRIRADTLVKGRIHLQRRAFADLVSGWVVFVHTGLLVGRMYRLLLQITGPITGSPGCAHPVRSTAASGHKAAGRSGAVRRFLIPASRTPAAIASPPAPCADVRPGRARPRH